MVFSRRPGMAVLLLLLLALSAAGCSTGMEQIRVTPEQLAAHLEGIPTPLHPLYEKELRDGPRNMVLNNMQIGVAAMEMGEWRPAEAALDKALAGIETVYAHDERAEKARGLWRSEGSKAFKGEPYERVMAYYYRGVLYMRVGDFENARACFKAGIGQDAFAEEEQHQCDFALMMFLEGWCSRMLGDEDSAQTAWKELKQYRPHYPLPPPGHNALVLVETGTAPRKMAGGREGQMMIFKEGEGFAEERALLRLGRGRLMAYPMEDIAWQAGTRGGRPMDGILEGQVIFKQTNQVMGQALTVAGLEALRRAQVKNSAELAYVGAILTILGLTQQVVAAAIRPDADIRSWSNLPDHVHVATFRLPPGRDPEPVEAIFLEGRGAIIPGMNRRSLMTVIHMEDGKTAGLAWIRSRSALFPAATY